MIIEVFLSVITTLMRFFINLIPGLITLPDWLTYMNTLISYALMFFPPDAWSVLISNFVFWMGVHMLWAIIEWVYKKIPGVD